MTRFTKEILDAKLNKPTVSGHVEPVVSSELSEIAIEALSVMSSDSWHHCLSDFQGHDIMNELISHGKVISIGSAKNNFVSYKKVGS